MFVELKFDVNFRLDLSIVFGRFRTLLLKELRVSQLLVGFAVLWLWVWWGFR